MQAEKKDMNLNSAKTPKWSDFLQVRDLRVVFIFFFAGICGSNIFLQKAYMSICVTKVNQKVSPW